MSKWLHTLIWSQWIICNEQAKCLLSLCTSMTTWQLSWHHDFHDHFLSVRSDGSTHQVESLCDKTAFQFQTHLCYTQLLHTTWHAPIKAATCRLNIGNVQLEVSLQIIQIRQNIKYILLRAWQDFSVFSDILKTKWLFVELWKQGSRFIPNCKYLWGMYVS